MSHGRLLLSRTRPRPLIPLLLAALVVVASLLTGGSESARAATGTPLDDSGLYPRAVRLEHNGDANGHVLTATTGFDGEDGVGRIYESTDDGGTFAPVGEVRPPESADGDGLCCGTLYELPSDVGELPAGTLLWSASVAQDAPDRRMSMPVYRSNDAGRSWEFLSNIAVAPNTGGLWEPEFSVDASGALVAHYSDETDETHSQKLMAARSTDGVEWTEHHATIASSLQTDRPGMAIVRKLPNGTYVMAYEICAPEGQFACVVHYRTSPDGWDWGDPTDLGIRPETADGAYFLHAPNLAWAPEEGNAQGRLVLVGQELRNADGTRAAGSGRTLWTNGNGGEGAWQEVEAPVAVESPEVDYCPNYSSALLPSSDGTRLLEIATDYDGDTCKPYYATGPS